jgi:hypothetical protein
MKPWYKNWKIIGGIVVAVLIIGAIKNQTDQQKNAPATNQQSSNPPATQNSALAPVPAPSSAIQPQPATGVVMANYNRVKTGMKYNEVVAILGKEGIEQSSNEIGGVTTVMYQWEGESFGANMNAMFQNGKLISKAQFGLK